MNHGSVAVARKPALPLSRRPFEGNSWLGLFAVLFLLGSASFVIFQERIFAQSEHIVLTLQGSTSLGDELMPQLAAAFLRDELGAVQTGSRVAGKDVKGHSYLRVWGKIPGRSGLQVIEIYASGSRAAFECLAAEGSTHPCDIGMASRPVTDSDKEEFPALRRLGDHSTEHVVALDGIAIIVNPQNPVSELSIPKLQAIYSGQITSWRTVGGPDVPIKVYGRDRNSGTFDTFTEKVFGKEGATPSRSEAVPVDRQIADSGLMVDAVMHSPNAIGYVSSPMIRSAKALAISDGTGPAFRPTHLSIVTEDYPICRRLLLYDWDAPGSLMDAFVRYVVYKPGQTLVEQTPFVDLTPKIFPVVPTQNAPRAYREIASKYSRIGLSFHFSSKDGQPALESSDQFDNLARVNVLRLRTYLAQRGRTGDDIVLLGFSDGHEAGIGSQNPARVGAEGLAKSLRAIGVIVPDQNIRDFGAQLPVASNDSPEGRRKNRRVEVWIRNGLQ
jgi:phosphate transport system substrate-binding protein